MALRATAIEVYFAVYDSTTGARITGDAANLSMVVGLDGADPVAATNAAETHGNLHSLLLTAAEMTAACVVVDGTSVTANAVVVPVVILTETAARAGDAMDLVGNAVDAAALATDAIAEIAAKLTTDHGAGAYNRVGGVTVTSDNVGPDELLNITVQRGDTPTLEFVLTDNNGVAIPLSGQTILFTVKDTLASADDTDTDAKVKATGTMTGDGTAGICTVPLTAADTNLAQDVTHYWDIQLSSGAVINSPKKGLFIIGWDITRRTS